eukprot:g6077.t1
MNIARAGVTSGGIHILADVLAQGIETRGASLARPQEVHDVERTGRFGLLGLTLHGPYFAKGFAAVDFVFGAPKNLRTVLKKTLAVQAFVNPPYLVLLFLYLGALEGKAWPGEILGSVREKIVPAFWAGNLFWPIANFCNFKFLAPHQRVAYVASCGAMWNTFISMLNKAKEEEKEEYSEESSACGGSTG